MLTPKKKYNNIITTSPRNLFFSNSPTLSISPKTKSWVSELIQMPSPQKKLYVINNSPNHVTKRNCALKKNY